jgi:hypothetical protein
VKEYQKKYKNEVEVPTTSTFINCSEVLKKYLGGERIKKNANK